MDMFASVLEIVKSSLDETAHLSNTSWVVACISVLAFVTAWIHYARYEGHGNFSIELVT